MSLVTAERGSIFPPWHFSHWKAVDDRVRGGASTSHLDHTEVYINDESEKGRRENAAKFHGHLDIDTLGGAGFASQRYTFAPAPLHLPPLKYKGVSITYALPGSSAKAANTFTLVLKTSLSVRPSPDKPKLPPNPEPASLSYEVSFTPEVASSLGGYGKVETKTKYFPFSDLVPTYRGRDVPRSDPRYEPFHSEKIYELSLMCRSGFGEQKGDFELVLLDVAGWKKDEEELSGAGGIWAYVRSILHGLRAWLSSW